MCEVLEGGGVLEFKALDALSQAILNEDSLATITPACNVQGNQLLILACILDMEERQEGSVDVCLSPFSIPCLWTLTTMSYPAPFPKNSYRTLSFVTLHFYLGAKLRCL
jgi:hypothetical protein